MCVRAERVRVMVAPEGSRVGDPAILLEAQARATGAKRARCGPVMAQFDVVPVLDSLWFEVWPKDTG